MIRLSKNIRLTAPSGLTGANRSKTNYENKGTLPRRVREGKA